jgi:hypothetical protein
LTLDERAGIDISCIHQVLTGQQFLLRQVAMDR